MTAPQWLVEVTQRTHGVIGAEMPQQGMAQVVPELMVLCLSCGWMTTGEYGAHVAQVIAAALTERLDAASTVEAMAQNMFYHHTGRDLIQADAAREDPYLADLWGGWATSGLAAVKIALGIGG